jgi:hypothetical protein
MLDAVGLAKIITWKLALQGAHVSQSIISDCGPEFTSQFWAAFCYPMSINQHLSTTHHLQMDRQTERKYQSLKQY